MNTKKLEKFLYWFALWASIIFCVVSVPVKLIAYIIVRHNLEIALFYSSDFQLLTYALIAFLMFVPAFLSIKAKHLSAFIMRTLLFSLLLYLSVAPNAIVLLGVLNMHTSNATDNIFHVFDYIAVLLMLLITTATLVINIITFVRRKKSSITSNDQ